MKQELADRLSAFDQTISSDDTRLGRWINLAQQTLGGEWNWPFLWTQDIIPTFQDYTNNTVSVDVSSADITFTATPSISFTDRYIQFGTETEWYRITSHTAGSTLATIDPIYIGSANLTASTLKIRKVYYSLDSEISGIVDVKIPKYQAFLSPMQALTTVNLAALLNNTGIPSSYYIEIPSSSGRPQIAFFPAPSEVMNVFVRGKKELTDLSLTTDVSIIPSSYHAVILDLAASYGFEKLNNHVASSNSFSKYTSGVDKMKHVYRQDIGRLRVMSAIDDEEINGDVSYNLPRNVTAP